MTPTAREVANRILESCWEAKTRNAVVYPRDLTARFFDLSSGEAGEILDKLRQFRIRLAIVCEPDTVQFSSRFSQILCDDLQVFDTTEAATAWLTSRD